VVFRWVCDSDCYHIETAKVHVDLQLFFGCSVSLELVSYCLYCSSCYVSYKKVCFTGLRMSGVSFIKGEKS